MSASDIRRARHEDLESLTETLWLAFEQDPLWRWAFPDHDLLRPWWQMIVASALDHDWVWTTSGQAAVAVWIPPGHRELSAAQETQAELLLGELLGPRSRAVLELLERFGASHPAAPPHYYLSLLGTHPAQRGKGLGISLLSQNLELIDRGGAPAYLESSNPANVPRYEALGFERVNSFKTPDEAQEVTGMWRKPRPV